MITAFAVSSLNGIVLALTAMERLYAMRPLRTDFMRERWFIITGLSAIVVLTLLLSLFSRTRIAKEQKAVRRLFDDYADKMGLAEREKQLLTDITKRAGLTHTEAIFTMENAFEAGAAKIMEENLTQQVPDEIKRLRIELFFLREKLGFQKQSFISAGAAGRLRKMSSRQIPAGKTLHITRRKSQSSSDIEATVVKNDYMELALQLPVPVDGSVGEFWQVRYYFGSSVWEFDSSVISCSGNVLVLHHSDNVRLINRRRFPRVPVDKPGFIARFPFTKLFTRNVGVSGTNRLSDLPEFVPAIVTELSGAGLCVKAPLDVKTGEKVLIVFRLDEQAIRNQPQNDEAPVWKIVEDIGEVRHTKAIPNGQQIAIELIGLTDSDISELIRATNSASIESIAEGQDVSDSVAAQEPHQESTVS
jgi:hypothetical protein